MLLRAEDGDLTKFWGQLLNSKVVGDVLKLGGPVFGLDGGLCDLLVRKSYVDLWDLMWTHAEARSAYRFVVSGSPGIGKTHFGVYLMRELAQRKQNIVYHSSAVFHRFDCDSRGVV